MSRVLGLVLRRRPLAVLAVLLAAGIAIPFSTPFWLLALVPLYGLAAVSYTHLQAHET